MGRGGIARQDQAEIDEQPWGHLEWMIAGRLGNSDTMTVGKCFIDAGRENPPHRHPNCDEVLHVLRGEIVHRVEDDYVPMGPGDTISIPQGMVHHARNTGSSEAVLLVSFSSPDREVIVD